MGFRSRVLAAAGTISLLIALLQFVMYFGGPDVYRWCGAPEWIIQWRRASRDTMFLAEIVMALGFATFAAYGYSGAGIIRRLPGLPYGLVATAVIYLGRGALVILQITGRSALSSRRDVLFSCIALVMGAAYGVPTYRHWRSFV